MTNDSKTLNIRRIILIISLIISLSTVKAYEFDFGIKAGVCLTGFSLINNIHKNPTLSAQGSNQFSNGLNFIVKLKSDDNWEIWMEPGFIKKGGMVKYIYHNPSLSMPVESYCGALYSDLELPFIFNYNLMKKLDGCLGIGIGYTISSEQQRTLIINGSGRNLLPDLDNKFNGSIITGLNYNLNESYALSLRYSFGLTKVTTADLVAETNYHFSYIPVQTSIYINTLQLSLIYSFNY